MNGSRFDAISKGLGNRLTRRAVVRSVGGGALGVASMGAFAVNLADAQEQAATPAASADGEKVEFLFVQTFAGGTWAPKAGEDGTYVLTLTGHAAQTIHFSDRPERIVGACPTVAFLDGLGFSPANPPNAAVVAQTDSGEDIVVVELLNPTYTEDFGPDGGVTLTYDVRVLEAYQEDGLAHLAQRAAQQPDAVLPAAFGNTSLFIDDCPDITECHTVYGGTRVGSIPGGPWGQCWQWSSLSCEPCSHPMSYYADLCNQAYPDVCRPRCYAE